jgi:hypothetical protein
MRKRTTVEGSLLIAMLLVAGGCGSDKKVSECTPGTAQGCSGGEVCEQTTSGVPGCFAPILVQGQVTNAAGGAGIASALVVALDANGAALSGTATSDAAGFYSLPVPVVRDEAGNPAVDLSCTLRADARGFQSFPTPPRVALPIKVSEPVDGIVASAATDIVLLPLPTTAGTGIITGTVALPIPAGTLVVAGGTTALVSNDGSFTLFNVPAGPVTVTAYHQGVNLAPVAVTVTAADTTQGVILTASAQPAVTVSGKVSIVNPGGGSVTSVILVVADTFVATAARGESPPGLRAAGVTGSFVIPGVPDGNYVVLAAFEDDLLVRDPDTCIAGTAIVTIAVAGSDVALTDSFKITGALAVVSPDNEELVSGTPTFVWADDSSEDQYDVAVYDAFGVLVWEDAAVPSVSGGANASVVYAGPPLSPGMVYQFRATSIRKGNCPISRTEDLRGVFRVM